MSLTLRLAAKAIGKLPGGKLLTKWKWGAGAFGSLSTAGSFGLGAAIGYYSYGKTYGMGTAALYAMASTYPITGIPLMLVEGTRNIANVNYQAQQSKRLSSFVKNKIDDRFGTVNRMRQFSGQQMRRDHSSVQRVLGNEAMLIHSR